MRDGNIVQGAQPVRGAFSCQLMGGAVPRATGASQELGDRPQFSVIQPQAKEMDSLYVNPFQSWRAAPEDVSPQHSRGHMWQL